MAIEPILAMTAAEIRNQDAVPSRIAWMACHFSPYGSGLSNLPTVLPAGSLLVVDDSTPLHSHDKALILEQLAECTQTLDAAAVLLDFQRPDNPETAVLVNYLSDALPCPLAVSDCYAHYGDAPVFLAPVPLSTPLSAYLAPWKGRNIWLDLSCAGEILYLTENGCRSSALDSRERPENGFSDRNLHCHYQITESENSLRFNLWRTAEDLYTLLEEAEALGVTVAVGLYQELYPFFA